MARTYRIISSDGHVETPPQAWTKYVLEKYRDRAPKLVQKDEGGEAWVIEGKPELPNSLNLTGPKTRAPGAKESGVRFSFESYWSPDGTPAPGAGDAAQRLAEQDRDGVDAEVLYPPVFAQSFIEGISDRKAYLSMVQAYNTHLAVDFVQKAPDRLIGNAVVPVSGVDDAIAELQRCKELGIRSVSPHMFPNGSGSPKPEDDRYWEAALKSGLKLSPHLGLGLRQAELGAFTFGEKGVGAFASMALNGGRGGGGPTYPMAQLIAHGVLDRFPDLRFYLAETNASWIPNTMWFMDDSFYTWGKWFEHPLKMAPSEYCYKHFLFSFIRDPMAMKLREFIPIDNLMWGSDFPHSVGSFPNSRGWIETIFEGVPADIKRKVLVENPVEFFGLDANKPITETSSVKADTSWHKVAVSAR